MVDEVPWEFQSPHWRYLDEVARAARRDEQSGASGMVVFNPGCVSSAAYLDLADITIVFEDTYETFRGRVASGVLPPLFLPQTPRHKPGPRLDDGRTSVGEAGKLGVVVHSVTQNISRSEMHDIINKVRKIGSTIFITEASSHFYQHFSPQWEQWIEALAKTATSGF
ncbi:hypothetical protein LTR84_011046 [Exophiala bonariae]|uniref:Dienelactone hydrolase domain-containing protein n=1 Tax=Exophiala bonariae TaxID=1690606 RepID=A0AAV9NJ59_9EURO|nr:hypothetical protein LTR84_011046 [Exophiala bonariae]